MKEIDCFVHEDVLYDLYSTLNAKFIIQNFKNNYLSNTFTVHFSNKENTNDGSGDIKFGLRSIKINKDDCIFCNSEELKLTNPELFI